MEDRAEPSGDAGKQHSVTDRTSLGQGRKRTQPGKDQQPPRTSQMERLQIHRRAGDLEKQPKVRKRDGPEKGWTSEQRRGAKERRPELSAAYAVGAGVAQTVYCLTTDWTTGVR
jgi:hypothetical protein